ncbi:Protein of unknown function [Cotesia congregata]|uniref:Uncharacterized protein n=1 Tax=Cotesia congregata TaxID=51543 RepID=A0A8J2HDH8_COTCN|nr:Protein of unknown function [Cotesia congregata]
MRSKMAETWKAVLELKSNLAGSDYCLRPLLLIEQKSCDSAACNLHEGHHENYLAPKLLKLFFAFFSAQLHQAFAFDKHP